MSKFEVISRSTGNLKIVLRIGVEEPRGEFGFLSIVNKAVLYNWTPADRMETGLFLNNGPKRAENSFG